MSVIGSANKVGNSVIKMTQLIEADSDPAAIAQANKDKTVAQANLTLAQTALGAAAG